MLKRIHTKHLFVRSLTTGATKDISGQVNLHQTTVKPILEYLSFS